MRTDLYQAITRSIIAAIEAGARSGKYRMPWHRSSGTYTPLNPVSRRPYRGINALLLWAAATEAGYPTGKWATYRQWSATGAQVRKGEQATVVLLWKTGGPGFTDQDQIDANNERSRHRMLARAFHVFNAAQVDGWTPNRPVLPLAARISVAETFFAALPAEVSHGSDDAFYDPASDNVFLPSFSVFQSSEAYYSVYAHELTHWTGVKSRLDRDLTGRFGSQAYAMEELVAELGAAFTVGYLELAATPREDHAFYIASWLAVLDGDPRAIVTAASRAQAAADYLIALAEPTPPIARPAVPECVK